MSFIAIGCILILFIVPYTYAATTIYHYDSGGKLDYKELPTGQIINHEFDKNGNLISVGNLLSNAGFENGLTGWAINNAIGGTSTLDASTVFNGGKSLKITRATSGDQYAHADYNFGTGIGGRTFTMSAYVKTADITGNGVRIATYWLDDAGWIWKNNVLSPVLTGTNDWSRLEVTAEAPAGAKRVVVMVQPGDVNGQGTFWIDSVAIKENAPPMNLLSNPGFENGLTDWAINNAIGGTSTLDASTVFSGGKSLKITRATSGDQYAHANYNFGTAIGGRTFTMSANVKTVDITGNGVHIKTYWQDDTGWIWQNNESSQILTGTNDWSRLEVTAEAPAGAKKVHVIVIPGDKNGKGTYWIDSLVITEKAPPLNLLSNPGFENGLTDWAINNAIGGTSTLDASTVFSGGKSLKITRATSGDQYAHANYNFGTAIGGRTFTMSANVKTVDITGNGVHIKTYWQDDTGWIWQNNESSQILTGTNDWSRLEVTAEAPAGAKKVHVIVIPGDKNGKGTYWIDSLSIR